MKQEGMIIVSEKKELFKYNSRDQKKEWLTSFKNRIVGISRIENFVFVLTTSWSTVSTSLVDYDTGDVKWTIKKIFYNVHIFNDSIIFLDTSKEVVSISLETGNENFRVKTGFRWANPKMALIDQKIYLFSNKRTVLLNLRTGALTETKLPSKLDSKETYFIIDEFQMNINTINSSDSGFFPLYDAGLSADGGDVGGGFDGGGGDAGGGE